MKGFQLKTKLQIIKAIYAKFLSLPEATNENFDFLEFIRKEDEETYNGDWKLYFAKKNFTTGIFPVFNDTEKGKLEYDEGVVYDMSDDKFIFNLMNFEKHTAVNMTNIFDILKKNYKIVEGFGENDGYHS